VLLESISVIFPNYPTDSPRSNLTATMSTLEDLDDFEREQKEEKKDEKKDGDGDKNGKNADGDAEMKDAEPEKEEDVLDEEILNSSTQDIIARRRLLENDMRIMKSEFQRLTYEKASMNEKIKDNLDKIENNRYVVHANPKRAALPMRHPVEPTNSN